MKLDDYKSLDEIPEKEMLKFLFSNQIQIMRQISLLQWHIDRKDNPEIQLTHYAEDISMFLKKTDTFLERVGEHLVKDDLEKGQLKL